MTESIKIEGITLWDRIQLVQALRAQRGNVGHVCDCLEIVKIVKLAPEEALATGYKEIPGGVVWKVEMEGTEYTLEVTDVQIPKLAAAAEGFQGWPVDERVAPLIEKLKALANGASPTPALG